MMANKKTVKLFFDGKLYKFLDFSGKPTAKEWMQKEMQLIPVHKRHRYYFEMPSILSQPASHKQNRKQ